MLEALEQIRKAEEENEKRAQTLRQQLKIQTNYRQQLKQLVEEKEQFEIQELEKEKMKLKAEADKVQATLKDQYQKHQSQAIGAIIERVKETYGRH